MSKVRIKPRSWQYANSVNWTDGKRGILSAAGKPDLSVATPPDFGGHEGVWSPEDMFVAAVNCCIMTTFLYYRGKENFDLVSYSSVAEGTLHYGEEGLAFTVVKVKPTVAVASESDIEKAERAIQRAESACLVSQSVRSDIIIEAQVQLTPGQDSGPQAS